MGLNKPGNITGVAVHNDLTGRNLADGHPIGAISGLQADLDAKASAINGAVNTANSADGKATTALSTAQTANSNAGTALNRIGTLASLNTTAKGNLVEAINENFTNANNGKTAIASAVNGKGGTANAGMTFAQLADAVTAIPTPAEATGNAVAGDVRAGKTFSKTGATGVMGTLAEKQGDNVALASSVSGTTLKLRAPAGIYDGTDDNVTLDNALTVLGGKRVHVATINTGTNGVTTFSGLPFQPSTIIADVNFSSMNARRVYNVVSGASGVPGGHNTTMTTRNSSALYNIYQMPEMVITANTVTIDFGNTVIGSGIPCTGIFIE